MKPTDTGADKGNQLETVAPATRLLEKRRQMYEQQEEYENKKKDAKTAELDFRDQERELRQKDLEIQESMIQFSVFLQENEKSKAKADEKIKQEKKLLEEKNEEIKRREKMLEILEKQAQRIERKMTAIKKYEVFLDEVRASSDEFGEIIDILARHQTLVKENEKLTNLNKAQEDKLEEMKNRVKKYEKDKRQEILQLNNDISNLKSEHEQIVGRQSEFREEADTIAEKKRNKVSEYAQILMAINNIEDRCLNRKYSEDKKGKIEKSNIRHQVTDQENKPKDYNNFNRRGQFAIYQLKAIGSYLNDFKEIADKLQEDKEKKGIKELIQKKKATGDFI